MNFQVGKSEFLRALHFVQTITQRRTTLPMLNHVLVQAEKAGAGSLTATDLDVSVKVTIDNPVVAESGTLCVNAKKLYEAVREIPEGNLQVRSSDRGRFEIESGKVSYSLLALEAKEFPSFPVFDGNRGVVEAATLEEMIKRTLFAVSLEEVRADINGVLLTQVEEGKFRMVGTDGHRLAVSEKSLPGLAMDGSVIVPRKGLVELKRLCEEGGELKIGVSKNMVYAETEAVALCVRTLDGEYPNYDRVIPRSSQLTFRVDQQELLAALKRVVVLSSDRFRAVHVKVRSGWMELSANNPELGEAKAEMVIDGEGPEIEVSFNSRYILEVTEVLSAGTTIEISLSDRESPAIVSAVGDSSYLYVVMPIRS